MIEIDETQRKRAANIVWNCAGRYDFRPDFRAYDSSGRAELYWNCIFGAARKHYDYSIFEELFRTVQQYEDAEIYENLLWLGLEDCTYRHEVRVRPALTALRQRYALQYVCENNHVEDFQFYETLSLAHFRRVLGQQVSLDPYTEKLLDELEFLPDLDAQEIAARARELLSQWFQIHTEERKKELSSRLMQSLKRRSGKKEHRTYKKFCIGIIQHSGNSYGGTDNGGQKKELKTQMSAAELRRFMEAKYGSSIYSPAKTEKIERRLCIGRHESCHLLITRGDRPDTAAIQNGFEALSRQREAAQIELNRASFQKNIAQNRTTIARLTEKIQNSVLLHLQYAPIRANTGAIDGSRIWRALRLGDVRVFTKSEADDSGELSVDILLDASTSQKSRQETVSAQGYIVAESLTRCGIPCRVMSFCSMTGYTVLRIFRDYDRPADNKRIFEYVSNGCNRDGLAISAARELMQESHCEHRKLIVLSDVKPNDIVKTKPTGADERVPYEKDAGLSDTALEVRRARAEGVAVICVFTGDDDDVPAAKLVYGNDFTRIKSLDSFADAVGRLIQNQIKNL